MYSIEYADEVEGDLAALRPFERERMVDTIDEQLVHQPTAISRHRKPLWGVAPVRQGRVPVWELRVGDHRAFYDVDEAAQRVVVRAVVHKGRRTTAQLLAALRDGTDPEDNGGEV